MTDNTRFYRDCEPDKEVVNSIEESLKRYDQEKVRANSCLDKDLSSFFRANCKTYKLCKVAIPVQQFEPFNLLIHGDKGASEKILFNWAAAHNIPIITVDAECLTADSFLLKRAIDENGETEYKPSAYSTFSVLNTIEKPFSVLYIRNLDKLPPQCGPGIIGIINDYQIEYYSTQNDGWHSFPPFYFSVAQVPTDSWLSTKLNSYFKHHLLDRDY